MSYRSILPYQIHTNRELGLMLCGKKPLAVFSDSYGRFPDVALRYFRLFDRHADRGTFLRREYVDLGGAWRHSPGTHVIMYALPGEEWRFDAMIELRLRFIRWSHALERREGELLGYSDWENDRFAEHLAAAAEARAPG